MTDEATIREGRRPATPPPLPEPPSPLLGSTVGNIRVVDILGRGGMGDVFLGFDERLKRKVALKSLRTHLRLDAQARARFLHEARMLSQLEHPGICRVYDLVGDGEQEFLVLELVQGVTLRKAIAAGLKRQQALDIAEQVARVLAAAHEKGIVHRDLKPDNVMLTPDGSVKVLDFGLARLVEEPTGAETRSLDRTGSAARDEPGGLAGDSRGYAATQAGCVVGTLGYMSPEQARGEQATSACDMYSFGLLVQDLLTGQRPRETDGAPLEILVKVAQGETRPFVDRDRDVVAFVDRLKSMAPAARPSAIDAAERLRWISGKPRALRLRLLGAGLAAVLVATTAVAVVQAVRAEREAARARLERARAEQVRSFLQKTLSSADPVQGAGGRVTVAELLDSASVRLGRDLGGQPEVEASLRGTLGDTYLNLGLFTQAEREYRRALEIAGPDPVAVRARLGQALSDQGRLEEAALELDRAVALCATMAKPIAACPEALSLKMVVLQGLGRGKEAAAVGHEALALVERSFPEDRAQRASVLNNLGICYGNMGETRTAEGFHRMALEAAVAAHGEKHPATADAVTSLAGILGMEGRFEEAEPLYRRALDLKEALLGERHPAFITTLVSYADLLREMKRPVDGEPIARRALALAEVSLGVEHPRTAYAENVLGSVLLDAGKASEAEGHIRRALEGRRRSLPAGHWLTANAQSNLGAALLAQRRFAEAERELSTAYATLSADRGPRHEKSLLTAARLAELYAATGRPAEAKRFADLSVASPPPR